MFVFSSVAELESPGAAIFRAALEPVPELILWSVGAESQSRLFNAAPAPSYRKAKKKSLVLVFGMESVQFIHKNMFQNRI